MNKTALMFGVGASLILAAGTASAAGGIAAEVAALMAGKITGASVDSGAVAQAVDGVMKERAR